MLANLDHISQVQILGVAFQMGSVGYSHGRYVS